MKITVAIDSLKGSLASMEAGNAAKGGILRVYPEAEVFVRPLADGGEGTVDALTEGLGGRIRTISVSDPLGRPLQADYGILTSPGQGEPLAVIEMAAASGLPLLAAAERNPLRTTTYGVGELILDAIRQGCRRFLIGIGGSATNDGGLGMLSALGYQFLKEDGTPVSPGAAGLSELSSIRTGSVLPELSACSFRIACDVTNPLCGPNGCSAVYGPQKGASREDIVNMDRWMQAYAVLTARQFPLSWNRAPRSCWKKLLWNRSSRTAISSSPVRVVSTDRLLWEKPPSPSPDWLKNTASPSSPSPAASPQMPSSVTMPESTPFSQFSAPSVRWKKQWNRHPPGRI